jgi:hypothetical protein
LKKNIIFSTIKSELRKVEKVLLGDLLPVGGKRMWGMGVGGVNMVQISCMHVCKWKNEACRNYYRNGKTGDKGK